MFDYIHNICVTIYNICGTLASIHMKGNDREKKSANLLFPNLPQNALVILGPHFLFSLSSFSPSDFHIYIYHIFKPIYLTMFPTWKMHTLLLFTNYYETFYQTFFLLILFLHKTFYQTFFFFHVKNFFPSLEPITPSNIDAIVSLSNGS